VTAARERAPEPRHDHQDLARGLHLRLATSSLAKDDAARRHFVCHLAGRAGTVASLKHLTYGELNKVHHLLEREGPRFLEEQIRDWRRDLTREARSLTRRDLVECLIDRAMAEHRWPEYDKDLGGVDFRRLREDRLAQYDTEGLRRLYAREES
jgi:hypothetical protein